MSRLGKKIITVPEGVKVSVKDRLVSVEGPKGALSQKISTDIDMEYVEASREIKLVANISSQQTRANHGLYRSLIANMVTGASQGYSKGLELEGVGYRVAMQGQRLTLSLGYCHPIEFLVPKGIQVSVDGNTKICLEGHDKQKLGQVAADLRALRPPEPYKGKGIRYTDEVIRRKVGKAVSK